MIWSRSALPALAVCIVFLNAEAETAAAEAALPRKVQPPVATVRHPKLPVVRHQKSAGEGYDPGSPLYGRQERLRASTGESIQRPSTAFLCIVCLGAQYFLVYTLFAVVRAAAARRAPGGRLEALLEACTRTVNYCPMLGALFLAARLRAWQLAGGDAERYGLPQSWAQAAMLVCTGVILGQLVVAVAFSVFTDGRAVVDSDGILELPAGSSKLLYGVAAVIRFVLMLCLYGGVGTICAASFLMRVPSELRGARQSDGWVPMGAAMWCTLCLAPLFFAMSLGSAITNTAPGPKTKIANAFRHALATTNLVPMTCILFMAARMRALQLDPVEGRLQGWAEASFYACTASIVGQTLVVLAVALILGGQAAKGLSEGEVILQVQNPTINAVLRSIRWVAMLCLYVSFVVVIAGLLLAEAPRGAAFTPEVSPTMQCVIGLNVQFFATYLALFMASMASQVGQTSDTGEEAGLLGRLVVTRERGFLSCAVAAIHEACLTVRFCPMLCVLFVGVRLRALQLSHGRGAPQGWAQDSMLVASVCVLLQLLLALCVGWMKAGGERDIDGRAKRGTFVMYAEALKVLFMVVMHLAAVTVVFAVYAMTPASATGSGSVLQPTEAMLPA